MEEDIKDGKKTYFFSTGMIGDMGFGPFLRKLTWEKLGFPEGN